jgi:N-acetyl-gamma-glutamyl-phosphate reductase
MEIAVHGAPDRLLLTARFDNLGKGASGAAVQCMNLMLGRAETDGVVL